jgi:hypothetical protein
VNASRVISSFSISFSLRKSYKRTHPSSWHDSLQSQDATLTPDPSIGRPRLLSPGIVQLAPCWDPVTVGLYNRIFSFLSKSLANSGEIVTINQCQAGRRTSFSDPNHGTINRGIDTSEKKMVALFWSWSVSFLCLPPEVLSPPNCHRRTLATNSWLGCLGWSIGPSKMHFLKHLMFEEDQNITLNFPPCQRYLADFWGIWPTRPVTPMTQNCVGKSHRVYSPYVWS